MPVKATSLFAFCFCFMFMCALTVHYSHVKTPGQYRGIASFAHEPVKPWYDASWKM